MLEISEAAKKAELQLHAVAPTLKNFSAAPHPDQLAVDTQRENTRRRRRRRKDRQVSSREEEERERKKEKKTRALLPLYREEVFSDCRRRRTREKRVREAQWKTSLFKGIRKSSASKSERLTKRRRDR